MAGRLAAVISAASAPSLPLDVRLRGSFSHDEPILQADATKLERRIDI